MAVGTYNFQQTINVSDTLMQDALMSVQRFILGEDLDGNVWSWRCSHCGSKVDGNYSCDQCGAPTPAWWARLDQMIATWKRGGR